MLKNIFIILILILFFGNHSYSGETSASDSDVRIIPPLVENLETDRQVDPLFMTKKDPFLAGFLSFFMMGAGHFYTGKYEKGSLLLFTDIVLKSMFIGLILHLKSEYTTDSQPTVYWRDLKATDRSLVLSLSILYAVVFIINVTDAVHSAHEYNRRYIREPSLNVGFNAARDRVGIIFAKKF